MRLDWGWYYNLTGHYHQYLFLTWNCNLVSGNVQPWTSGLTLLTPSLIFLTHNPPSNHPNITFVTPTKTFVTWNINQKKTFHDLPWQSMIKYLLSSPGLISGTQDQIRIYLVWILHCSTTTTLLIRIFDESVSLVWAPDCSICCIWIV